MLTTLLQALAAYFVASDDPTPGAAASGDPPSRDNERLRRLIVRTLVELAQNQRALNQQLQQNTADIAAIKTKLGL